MPAGDSVEPGESSLLACSGDSPSLLLSSSKAKASAGLGKLTWVPAGGEGEMVRAPLEGGERGGRGDGVSPVGCPCACAHLLQSWLRLPEGAQTPPVPSHPQGQLWGGSGGGVDHQLLACAIDHVTREEASEEPGPRWGQGR